MLTIRSYRNEDAEQAGRLIADTYTKFNLAFVPTDELPLFLGPFQHAHSPLDEHKAAITEILRAAILLIADSDGQVVGILRGRSDKLQSLFVREDYHRRGVGRQLVEYFEQECLRHGGRKIKIMSTLFAVPFYTAMGYKRSTGVRRMTSFDGRGLPYQPLKKILKETHAPDPSK
ncbi:MAG: hypothetical protein CVU39_21555 [Chloroflexi bacterium HGW-Chloroflexi-10]|nr:MAG: hypothetical protein CVU39_21555 [Chloroflexi bacterium HGW-Chloroflexi-10]